MNLLQALGGKAAKSLRETTPGVAGMERVYFVSVSYSNSFAYQPKYQLQSSRAKRATWLNGAKEYLY